jgi:signal transduction protein with GAF and PtsI domain
MDPESNLSRADLFSCGEIGKTLTAQLDSDGLFLEILRKVSDRLPAENWSLFRVDEASQELTLQLRVDLDPRLYRDVRLQPGEGVAGGTARDPRTIVVADVTPCPFFPDKVDDRSGIPTRSLICIPLVYRGLTVGVLEAIIPGDNGAKTREVLEIIRELCETTSTNPAMASVTEATNSSWFCPGTTARKRSERASRSWAKCATPLTSPKKGTISVSARASA